MRKVMTQTRRFLTRAWVGRPQMIYGEAAACWRKLRGQLEDARTEVRITRALLNAGFGQTPPVSTPVPTDTVEQRARAGR